jgi:hypothetical protein
MCTFTLFQQILSLVAEETEVSPDDILSPSRKEEVVDARCLLVYVLLRCGFSRGRTASLIHQTVRSVGYILASWEQRRKKRILGINLENIRKQLGSNFFSLSL